ncbi:MAG TPA: hypothetical protein VLI72_15185 [Methylibium sp.]|nr:hypothetical protein [Methylibium sp.]
MDEPLVQKTERGRQALQSRGPALDARSRQLLVLCNGSMPTAALRVLFGEPTDDLLQGLLGLGLIEPAGRAPRVARVERDAEPAPAMPAPAPAPAIDLPAAQARALELLERLFGPGGGSHGQAVRQARDAVAFEQALRGVQDALGVYQGARRAARLVQQIRSGS